MFRDKSSSFYTSTPVSIETTYCNKGNYKKPRKEECGCEEEKHDDCDARCTPNTEPVGKNVPVSKNEPVCKNEKKGRP